MKMNCTNVPYRKVAGSRSSDNPAQRGALRVGEPRCLAQVARVERVAKAALAREEGGRRTATGERAEQETSGGDFHGADRGRGVSLSHLRS